MTLLLEHEVAAELRCSKSTVYRLRKAGKLLYAAGKPVKIERGALDAYRKSLFSQPTQADTATISDADVAALARSVALKRRLAKGR